MLLENSRETAPERLKRLNQCEKKSPVVDMTGDGSKVWCYKEQYCIGTWNVHSMNQHKLEAVKQEMKRVNIDILGISELKWTRISSFSVVQSLSHVQHFATPWIAARQASLSTSISRSSQTHVHRVRDAIQPSHPLSSPSPPAPNLSQHQSLFQWVNSLHDINQTEFQTIHFHPHSSFI